MDRNRNRNRKLLRAAASDDHHRELQHGQRGGLILSRSSRSCGLEEEPEVAACGHSGTDSDDSDSSSRDGGVRVYRCTQCDESFGSWQQLELHARCHVGEQRLRCHLCNRRFRLQSQLKQHLNTHLAQKPHACPDCGKTFLHKSSVRYHQLIHAGTKPHGCSRCGRRFRSTSQRKVHMCPADTKKLGKSKKLRCSECGEMFGKRLLLMVHERVHQGKRLFTCSFCGVQLLFRSCLEKHLRSHTGERPFSCTDCHKRFRWSSQIKNHKCAPPLDPKKHACLECSAAFPSKAKLLVHLRLHQGKKLYTCSICALQYQYKSQVDRHMRSHTGEKLFGCNVCRRRFAHVGTARQHQLMHGQEKPFSCNDCGRSFTWRFQIKKHRCQSRVTQSDGKLSGLHQSHASLRRDSDQMSEPPPELADGESWRRTQQVRSRFTYQRKKAPISEHHTSQNPDQRMTPKTCTRSRPPESANHELQTWTEPQESGSPIQRNHIRCVRPETGGAWRHPEVSNQAGSVFEGHQQELPHIKEELQEAKISQSTSSPDPVKRCCGGPPGVPVEAEDNEKPELSRECPGDGSGCSGCSEEQLLSPCYVRPASSTCSTFSCSVCSSTFACTDALILHMRSHARQTRFSCSVCGKDFSWRRHLTKHMDVHIGEDIHQAQLMQRRKVYCRTKPGQDELVHKRTPPVDSPFSSLSPNEVKQENQEEPCHIKEELQEAQISQTSYSPVRVRGDHCGPGAGHVKSEEDEKPRSVLGLHHTYPGPGAGSVAGPRMGLREGPSDSSETDISDEDWTDHRETRPAVSNEAAEHQDSEDSDFWKDEW